MNFPRLNITFQKIICLIGGILSLTSIIIYEKSIIFHFNNYIIKKNKTVSSPIKIKQSPKLNPKLNITTYNFVVQKGDTLTSILKSYLKDSEILLLAKKSIPIFPLNKLKQGQPYTMIIYNNKLYKFKYEVNTEELLTVDFIKNDFKIYKSKIKYDIEKKFIKGTITSSLFNAIEKAGEKDQLAFLITDIFAWDINFLRDIRKGDSFKIIVEKKYRHRKFKGYGRILGAEFINQGIKYIAILYTTKTGRTDYFNERGIPLRKNFLKAPLKFTRISSKFSYHRYHPILKKVLPHLGIDYAAPIGTPIKAVADGWVIKKAYDKAAGKYVKLGHANGYETIYNHMIKFSKGLKKGKKVQQGEIIGYVGMTGYATGPHLDFRIKHYGKYINPLKIKSKPLKPLSEQETKEFLLKVKPILTALKQGETSLLASNK